MNPTSLQSPSTIELESLANVVSTFSPTQCNFFAECCIVALENASHSSGCLLHVKTNLNNLQGHDFTLNWNNVIAKGGYQEMKKVWEHAAEAIAFLLTEKITEFEILLEARIGTGFDYWLAYKPQSTNYDPDNFFNARFEISGIGVENSSNTIKNRTKIKEQQTDATANINLPAYVCVAEFSTPKAYYGLR